ncbi:hypothetical protein AAC387_Pa02g3638 [Persea americana]
MLHGFCWYFDILNFSPLSHLNGKMTGTRIVMVDNELLPIILAMGSSAFYFFYDGLYCRGAFNDQQSPLILLDPILSYLAVEIRDLEKEIGFSTCSGDDDEACASYVA